jgi:hypothetical protein
MKSNKLAFVAIAVGLAWWASNAQSQVLGRFEKLNFSLVAMQQEIDDSVPPGPYGNVLLRNIETSKITSKDLLKYLATALNTNWPAGAQLALGEREVDQFPPDIVLDIFVVDETGTNPVFDVSTGATLGTNIVYFSYDSDRVVVSSKSVSLEKTNELLRVTAGTEFGKIFFHLFDEQNGIIKTDLYFEGVSTIEFHSSMASTTNKITEHGTTSEQAPVTGDGTFNDEWTVVKGKVTGSMEWKDFLIRLFPNPLPPPILLTNWPPPIRTNWPPIIITNRIPFTNIFIITNRPPRGSHPITNPLPPIIPLNP